MGGGLANSGTCGVVNLTLSGNAAVGGLGGTNFSSVGTNGQGYGGSLANTGSLFRIVNSILAGGVSNNAYGAITDLGHNISSDATPVWTSGTSSNNLDPLLLPLADNGGPTPTMALRTGSPALNTADCASAPSTDQRGHPRPDGPGCDIGAYEGAGVPQLQVLRENSSTNVLRWMAEANRTYRVEGTAAFSSWTPIVTNIAGANGWVDLPVPTNGTLHFFRLLVE